MKQPETKEQYIEQLRRALKAHNVKDVDDIIEDYEDYFAHSIEKGYSEVESIRRLPSARELSRSYESDASSKESESQPDEGSVSHTGRISLFAATVLTELLLLPFVLVAGLFFACIGAAGIAAFAGGILMAVPENVLGGISVPRPPIWQFLPVMILLMAGGIAAFGTMLIIAERTYSAIQASILIKRWMLTGKHSGHLKLVPPISKTTRHMLYRVVLAASFTAAAILLVLIIIALITTGSPDFIKSWNV